ncbi:Autotransporter adhesin [Bibersteinia trehalosi USDA-ARS-USMARC-190]|uniref:Autotransporter adhesin n=1 Tax=Bibersteinia trehalosi USDA-ARS-USMARC-190 TaxID=1263832 RepID=W0RAN3_BIBTR|nr:YadA-like family protein [Bibersteinia trehalosi]AHG87370.1 Autotransporter adhesin [Bibersteinia trehalosi USDA-ARS-USMARC-190]
MNKVFKVVWNAATQTWVAVSELQRAKGKTKSKSLANPVLMAISAVGVGATMIGGVSAAVHVNDTASNYVLAADGTGSSIPAYIIQGVNVTGTVPPNYGHLTVYGTDISLGSQFTPAWSALVGNNISATGADKILYGNNISSDSFAQSPAVAIGRNLTLTGAAAMSDDQTGYNSAGESVLIGHDLSGRANNVLVGTNLTTTEATTVVVGILSETQGARTTAFGYVAKALGAGATALGTSVTAASQGDVAIGDNSNTTGSGYGKVAIGYATTASGQESTAVGRLANATATYATALGSYSCATAVQSVAIGTVARANGENGAALGAYNTVNADRGTAVGSNNQISTGSNRSTSVGTQNNIYNWSPNSTAVGNSLNIFGESNTLLGSNASAMYVSNSVGIGTNINAGSSSVIAMGHNTNATGSQSIAIGCSTTASGINSIAFGSDANAIEMGSVAIAAHATATGRETIAIGLGANATHTTNLADIEGGFVADATGDEQGDLVPSIAIGAHSNATSSNAIAIGTNSNATGNRAIGLGAGTNATGNRSIALGWLTVTEGNRSSAVGASASVTGDYASAVGTGATVSGTSAGAFGAYSNVMGNNTYVLGSNISVATEGSVVLGNNSAASTATNVTTATVNGVTYTGFAGNANIAAGDYVSIGAAGEERQIKNVAPGDISANSTDAINGSQLYLVAAEAARHSVVAAGANISSVTTSTATNGATVYTVNAIDTNTQASVSSDDGSVTISQSTNSNGTTNYDLSFTDNDTVTSVSYGRTYNTSSAANAPINVTTSVIDGVTDYAVNVLTTPLIISQSGATSVSTSRNNQLMNASQISAAINNSGFQVSTGTADFMGGSGTQEGASYQTLVTPGDQLIFNAGNNLVISQSADRRVTYGLNPDFQINSITIDPNISSQDAGIDMGDTKISNLANGTNASDAVNLSQLNASKTFVQKGNHTSVSSTTNTDGSTNYIVNADNIIVTSADSSVIVTPTSTTNADGTLTYTYDLAVGAVEIDNYFHVNNGSNSGGDSATNLGGVGVSAGATALNSLAAGINTVATAYAATAMGYAATASNNNTVAIGSLATASAAEATTVGYNSTASGQNASAFGSDTTASGVSSLAVGTGSTASADSAVAIGNDANAIAQSAVAIGESANATGNYSTAVGDSSTASGLRSAAFGIDANATAESALAAGDSAISSGYRSNAVGFNAQATAAEANALGTSATATAVNAVAVGDSAAASIDGSVALGNNSTTSNAVPTSSATVNGISYSGFAGSSPVSVVSVGSVGAERQIQNVAAGQVSADSTDAINGSQLYLVAEEAAKKSIVAAGENISSVTTSTLTNGSVVYTVNAIDTNTQASVTSTDGTVLVSASTNANGTTNYDLSVDIPTFENGTETTISTNENGSLVINVNTGSLNNNANGSVVADTTNGNIATVTDVANAINNSGWNTTLSDGSSAQINPGDTLNYVNGTGTTANVSQNADGSYSVSYDVNTANTTTVTNGKVEAPTDGASYVNATTLVETINSAGWNLFQETAEDANLKDTVTAGDNVVFANGTNTQVNVTNEGNTTTISYSVEGDLTNITSITNNNGSTSISLGNNTVNVNNATVSNVANGTNATDAVNLAQLNASKVAVEAGNHTTISTTTNADGSTTYTVNANHTAVEAGTNVQLSSSTDGNGLTTYNVSVAGDLTNITSITNNAGNTITVGNGTIITNTNGTAAVDPNSNATDIATIGDIVNTINNVSWLVAGNGEIKENITAGEVVNFVDGNNTVAVVTANATTGGADVTYNVEGDLTNITSISNNDGTSISLGNNTVNVNNATVSNVANGTNATDAVNLAQLNASKVAVEAGNHTTISTTTNADGSTTYTVNANHTVVEAGTNVQLSSSTDGNGLTTYNVSVAGDLTNITSITNNAGNTITVGNGTTITNTNGTAAVDPNSNATDIATIGDIVNTINNVSWSVAGNGAITENITAGEVVNFVDGNNTVAVVTANATTGGADVTYHVEGDLTNITSISNNEGTTISLGNNTVNVNNATISNVAEGVNGTDAVNVNQLNSSIASVTWKVTGNNDNDNATVVGNGTVSFNDSDTITANVEGMNISFDVKAGELSNNANGTVSFDTANGSVATVDQVADAINNSGWQTTLSNGNTTVINPGNVVNYSNGTNTVANVTQDADGNINVSYDVAGDLTNITSITNNAGNTITVGNGTTITNTNGTAAVDPNSNATDIATIGDIVNTINNVSWTVAGNGADVEKITAGEVVNFVDGNNTVAVVTANATTGGADVTYHVEGDLTNITSISNNDGTSISLGNNTVNVNNATVSNVANGTNATDAVNLAQLNASKAYVKAGNFTTVTSTSDANGTTYIVNAEKTVVAEGDNVNITTTTTAEGLTTYTVNVAGELNNITTINNNGTTFTFGNGTTTVSDEGKANISTGANTTDVATIGDIVNTINNVSWTIAGNGVNVDKITAGEVVNFVNGTNTVAVVTANATTGGADVTYHVEGALTNITSIANNNGTQITLGDVNGNNTVNVNGATISNVSAGVNGTDAVNLDQLNASKTYIDAGNFTTVTTTTNADGSTTYVVNAEKSVVEAGDNVNVTTTTTAEGLTTYTVNVAGNLNNITTISNANTTLTVGNGETTVENGKAQVASNSNATDIATVGDIVNTLNNISWSVASTNVTGTNGETTYVANENSSISAGDTVSINAGQNIKISGSGDTFEIHTTDNVTFVNTNVTGDLNVDGNTTVNNFAVAPNSTVDMGGNRITNVGAGSNATDAVNVSQLNSTIAGVQWKLTGNNDNANATTVGNQTVSFNDSASVKANVDGVNVSFAVKSGDISPMADGSVFADSTNGSVATVGDVANAINNAGWKTTLSDGNTTLITPSDVVNFNNGVGTTANVVTNANGGIDVSFNVNKTALTVSDGNIANPDGSNVNSGAVVSPDTNNANHFVTAGDLANTLNLIGWNVNSTAVEGSTGKVTEDSDSTATKVSAGNTVNINAGNNIEITRNGANVAIATSMTPTFNTVQVGGSTGPVIGASEDGNVRIAKADGSAARITNVAPGVDGTDAVNVDQLKAGLGNVHNHIGKVDRNLRAGIAGANAAAGLPQVYIPGKSMVAAAAGTFKGQSAVAVGYSRASDNGKVILKLQGNANTRGDFGGSVGVGYQW